MQVPRMIRIEHFDCEELLETLLQDFVENFEAARDDRVFQQLMISAPPVSTGNLFADGLIAATAEHLATSRGLRVPAWVNDDWRGGPSTFSTTTGSLAKEQGSNVPSAFFRRRIAGSWPAKIASMTRDAMEGDRNFYMRGTTSSAS